MSGWQLSGDAPPLYNRFAIHAMEQWTDDLIRQANIKDGERVLDVACGTGFVTLRVKEVSRADCELTGLDVNEGMLNAASKESGRQLVAWQRDGKCHFQMRVSTSCCASKGCYIFRTVRLR